MVDLSDAKQFKAGYEQHFTGLKYFAMRFVDDEQIACDLLQDLFVRLWERGDKYENEHTFIVYLYRAMRNQCFTWLRDNKRKEARMAGYEAPQPDETLLNQIIEAEVYSLINDVFAELSPSAKAVYIRSLDGKSQKEIAEELKIAVNTIKRHKNNANRYLRERLKKLFLLIAMGG